MAIYKIGSFYKGEYPVTVTVNGDQFVSNEGGEFVDPPVELARMLEGMPEWNRTYGDHPYGEKDVVTGVLAQQVVEPQDS